MEKPNETKTQQQQTQAASEGKGAKNHGHLAGPQKLPHKGRRPTFDGSVTKPPETTAVPTTTTTTDGEASGGVPLADGT